MRFLVRTGPALGLIGTLVPIGLALTELAMGNLPSMAGQLVTSFTTAIVGLALGVLSCILSMVKDRWIRRDLMEITYLLEEELLKF